jgi:hypothetical protein
MAISLSVTCGNVIRGKKDSPCLVFFCIHISNFDDFFVWIPDQQELATPSFVNILIVFETSKVQTLPK